RKRFVLGEDDVPPALLYLTIRAARRALAVNPSDAQSHLVLGETYLRLLKGTRERVWAEQVPELAQLRRAQASAALNKALALDPALVKAHLTLGQLYQEIGYLEPALRHLRTGKKLADAGIR